MMRSHLRSIIVTIAFSLSVVPMCRADDQPSARQLLSGTLDRLIDIAQPPDDAAPQTFTAQFKLVKSQGLSADVSGLSLDVAYQAPDRLQVSGGTPAFAASLGRDGQTLWINEPQKQFAILGKSGVPLFSAEPQHTDNTVLPPFKLPISRLKLSALCLLLDPNVDGAEKINGQDCDILRVGLMPKAARLLSADGIVARLWISRSSHLPLKVTYTDSRRVDIEVDVIDPRVSDPWPADKWKIHPSSGEAVTIVPLAHLVKFIQVAPQVLSEKIPTLGPATGSRRVVATDGQGRLEMIDGTRVLFLKGSPREMGHEQGTLLSREVHAVTDHILYGVGVGSSFAKGKWFFGEIEGAESRLQPYMDKRYLAEMDAMADAAGMDRQEGRLGNFFPELFHCSGFSLYGKATRDGHMFHGRVLDYLKGVGLEQNAVVMVYQPDYGNAWVNLGYAGFIGSVTAMNEKGISIGEMGGGGYGLWDGKPMAQLVREVMEKSNTLDDAVRIMRESPRTCHYYYVISDGKSKQAVGIAATPTEFTVVKPGEAVPQLPHAFEDAVLLSAGDRYETLCQRVRLGYGSFDADSARQLMTRPVCMTSNIQAVLFEPDTLDFWVANADSHNVAAATRYTHYNLRELLRGNKEEAKFEF